MIVLTSCNVTFLHCFDFTMNSLNAVLAFHQENGSIPLLDDAIELKPNEPQAIRLKVGQSVTF